MLVIEVVLVTPSSTKVTLYITGPHTLLTSDTIVHDIVNLSSLMSSSLIVGELGGPVKHVDKNKIIMMLTSNCGVLPFAALLYTEKSFLM